MKIEGGPVRGERGEGCSGRKKVRRGGKVSAGEKNTKILLASPMCGCKPLNNRIGKQQAESR